MKFVDYYSLLEVSRDSDQATIKKRYRELCKLYHPDINPEVSEAETQRFHHIKDAWETLKDDHKRAEYNRKLRDFEIRHKSYEAYHNPETTAGKILKGVATGVLVGIGVGIMLRGIFGGRK